MKPISDWIHERNGFSQNGRKDETFEEYNYRTGGINNFEEHVSIFTEKDIYNYNIQKTITKKLMNTGGQMGFDGTLNVFPKEETEYTFEEPIETLIYWDRHYILDGLLNDIVIKEEYDGSDGIEVNYNDLVVLEKFISRLIYRLGYKPEDTDRLQLRGRAGYRNKTDMTVYNIEHLMEDTEELKKALYKYKSLYIDKNMKLIYRHS